MFHHLNYRVNIKETVALVDRAVKVRVRQSSTLNTRGPCTAQTKHTTPHPPTRRARVRQIWKKKQADMRAAEAAVRRVAVVDLD